MPFNPSASHTRLTTLLASAHRRGPRALTTLLLTGVTSLLTTGTAAASPGGDITRFAGFSQASGTPSPGSALASHLGQPYAVATDASGNVYICDASAYEIEKVTPSGQLSIIAGTGSYGSGSPIAGPALSSPITNPLAISVDGAGNVYVLIGTTNQVVEITPAGVLSIVAGDGSGGPAVPGPAVSSPLNSPDGLAVDAAGDIYIADYYDDTIDEVNTSGNLSIVAGTEGSRGTPTPGPATGTHIGRPQAVAVDGSGNLFIADGDNNIVEKVTSAGTLSIFAGNGSYSGTPVPGPATSSPMSPYILTTDAAGNLFIGDAANFDVDEVTPSGQLSLIAGITGTGATPTYGGPATSSDLDPFGIAALTDGTLFVADLNNDTIDRIGSAVPGPTGLASVTPTSTTATVTFTAPTDQGTSAISGYESSVDGGASWQAATPTTGSNGALSVSLTGLTPGTTYQLLTRAENSSGWGASSPAASFTTAAAATGGSSSSGSTGSTSSGSGGSSSGSGSTSTGSKQGTTHTTTTHHHHHKTRPTAPSVRATLPSAGLSTDHTGQTQIKLSCPPGPHGCDASGILTLHQAIGTAARDARRRSVTAAAATVLARFEGEQIAAGHSRLISVRLTPAAFKSLQDRGIRRVKATLAVSDHLHGGRPVKTLQSVWLLIPAKAAAAPKPTKLPVAAPPFTG